MTREERKTHRAAASPRDLLAGCEPCKFQPKILLPVQQDNEPSARDTTHVQSIMKKAGKAEGFMNLCRRGGTSLSYALERVCMGHTPPVTRSDSTWTMWEYPLGPCLLHPAPCLLRRGPHKPISSVNQPECKQMLQLPTTSLCPRRKSAWSTLHSCPGAALRVQCACSSVVNSSTYHASARKTEKHNLQ